MYRFKVGDHVRIDPSLSCWGTHGVIVSVDTHLLFVKTELVDYAPVYESEVLPYANSPLEEEIYKYLDAELRS